VTSVSAMEATVGWIVENDAKYETHVSTFTSSDLQHADSAFEFVFVNLSLHKYTPSTSLQKPKLKIGPRSYLVLPKFASSSATSFEIFTNEVRNIIKTIDGLDDRVSVTALHPDNIKKDKRSPHPVVVLQWHDEVEYMKWSD